MLSARLAFNFFALYPVLAGEYSVGKEFLSRCSSKASLLQFEFATSEVVRFSVLLDELFRMEYVQLIYK